jgi:hypothetical protein
MENEMDDEVNYTIGSKPSQATGNEPGVGPDEEHHI